MIISFAGHSILHNRERLREKLIEAICENLPVNEKVSFYCGGYGEFDILCAQTCHALKKPNINIEVLLITPYITEFHQKKLNQDPQIKELYDAIVYPPLESVPLRYAIIRRNEWMMEQADLIIAFVTHTFGGAHKALLYAKRKKKKIINLSD